MNVRSGSSSHLCRAAPPRGCGNSTGLEGAPQMHRRLLLPDTWASRHPTAHLTPGVSDAGELGRPCQRVAACRVHTVTGLRGPLSPQPPPSWPLGDQAAWLGRAPAGLARPGCSDGSCHHDEEGRGSRGDPGCPGLVSQPPLSHSPGRGHPPSSGARAPFFHPLRPLCSAGPGADGVPAHPLRPLSALPWQRGGAAVNKQSPPCGGSTTTPATPWQGPDWPGGAGTARQGLSSPVLKGNEEAAPPTPALPEGRSNTRPTHPAVGCQGQADTCPPLPAFLTGQATPSLASG